MKHATLLLIALLLATSLTGCWWNRNRRDPNFGYSVRSAKEAQIINPSTGNTEPVTGMNGQAADNIMKTYQSSFGSPEAAKGGGSSNDKGFLPLQDGDSK